MDSGVLRILHIDDDEALTRLVARALGRRGYEVENINDSAAGLKRIAEGGIDVIILDHYLASGTGMSMLEQLGRIPDAPPVVYVTGSSETPIAVEAMKLGAADYVHKTVDDNFLVQLTRAIEQAVEKARLGRAKERAEQEVRAARDRAELLLAEVNHRVANSLALTASLVRMQASAVTDPIARDALNETQARISAIAQLHRRLYTSDDVRTVELDAYIAILVRELDSSMSAAGRGSATRLDLATFAMPTDRAVAVGMIVTELLTNAYKYAYPGGAGGEIRVKLQPTGESSAILSIEDDGIGWNGKGKPKGTGLGTRIVQAMATNLGSEIVYGDGSSGTRVEIRLNVTPAAAG